MAVGLFIDGSYMYKCWNDRDNLLDYKKIREVIEKELSDKIVEAYYFNADDDPPKFAAQNNYLQKPYPTGPGLRVKIGWLNRKPLIWPDFMGTKGAIPVLHPETGEPYVQTTQKSVDVEFIYYLIKSFTNRRWDKLVIAAGDGDFSKPIQDLVENHGVELYIIGTPESISPELSVYASQVFNLNNSQVHKNLGTEKKAKTER